MNVYRLPNQEEDGLINMTADVVKTVYTLDPMPERPASTAVHDWQVGDLGQLKGYQVLLVDAQLSIWVSQNGDCGYWPAAEVAFVRSTGLIYRYIHWKETVVDFMAGKFEFCFKS